MPSKPNLSILATLSFIVLLLGTDTFAQSGMSHSDVPVYRLPAQNNQLLAEAAALEMRSTPAPPRFAKSFAVDITPWRHGRWVTATNDTAIWQLRIESPTAYSLNLGFSELNLPPGARLYLFDTDEKRRHGPFQPNKNDGYSELWTPVIPGPSLLVEVRLPRNQQSDLQLRLSTINHDFKGFTTTLGNSGNCNLDVVCGSEEGWGMVDNYRDIIQSVGLYTVEGNRYCTGFLVNTTRNDCQPVFMTANHCEVNADNAVTMVVYWNFNNSFCREPGSIQAGGKGDGFLTDFNIGSRYLAGYEQSDFTLVELLDSVSSTANAYFAGWDARSSLAISESVCIHHPNTQEKRISFEFDQVYRGRWGEGSVAFPDGDHLIVGNWEVGTTEAGSSGAPLFNNFGRVIGQLRGGIASCDNDDYDTFGWFHASWEGGGTPKTRLKDWLDPENTGVLTIPGHWQSECDRLTLKSAVTPILCPGDSTEVEVRIGYRFTEDVQLNAMATGGDLELSFDRKIYSPGDTARLTVKSNSVVKETLAFVDVNALSSNDESDSLNFTVRLSRPPGALQAVYPAAGAQDVPIDTVFRWQSDPLIDQYQVLLIRDEPPFDTLIDQTSGQVFLAPPDLGFGKRYRWEVRAINRCGTYLSDFGSFQTLPDIRLNTSTEFIKACKGDTASFDLAIGSGYEEPVQLTYEVQPENEASLEVVFDPDAVRPGNTVRIQLENYNQLPVGAYQLTLKVGDMKRLGTRTIVIFVQETPRAPILLTPQPDTGMLEDRPIFSWTPATEEVTYSFVVATDPGFQNRVQETELLGLQVQCNQPLAPGKYYWRVVASNECGVATSQTNELSIQTRAIGSLGDGLEVGFAPNPTTGKITLFFSRPATNASPIRLELFNMQGRLLQEITGVPETATWEVDLRNYSNGVYILRLQQAGNNYLKRVLLHRG